MLRKSLIAALKNNTQLFRLPYSQFIKTIQEVIPESSYLSKKANASAEGIAELKSTKNFHGLTADEEIRAFAGLLRFKDVMNGTEEDYKNFVACQIEMKKPVLSSESFKAMHDYVTRFLTTPEDLAAAMWSILCNDLGKVHVLEDEYLKLPGKTKIGHDTLLAELLQHKPTLFSGFMDLPEALRGQIAAGYASGCDISQFEQLELPIVSLEGLKKLDKKALDHYILHTIFDVSGAAALFKSNGSLTMHQDTWDFFNSTRESLERLHQDEFTIEEAYAKYLEYRGMRVGIKNTSAENFALIRIAGLARLASPEQGEMLLEIWKALPEQTKKILVDELTVHGGKGNRAIFIGYGVAMLINAQNAMLKELNEKSKQTGQVATPMQIRTANSEGLRIGLINLAQAFQVSRKLIGADSNKDLFVAECEEIAKSLGKDPKKTLEMDWEISAKSDRRIDFKLINRKPSVEASSQSVIQEHKIPAVDFKPVTKKPIDEANKDNAWLDSKWKKVAVVGSVVGVGLFSLAYQYLSSSNSASLDLPKPKI
ncbi:MAG: hypothetical protein ABI597_03510 [Gammaproteobacteria bacterium]